MPKFDFRDFAARQEIWNPGGSTYTTVSVRTSLNTSTSSASRELVGGVSDTIFGSSSTRYSNHNVGTSIAASGMTTSSSTMNCTGRYQVSGIQVYESITSEHLDVTNITARAGTGADISSSVSVGSVNVSESGLVTVNFTVNKPSSVPAGVLVNITATLSGTVQSTYYSRSGTGLVHFGAQTTSETTYAHTVSNWTDCTGTYTDASSSMGYRVGISVTQTVVDGANGTAIVSLTAYTKTNAAPSNIGCVLTLTGTATTSQYSVSGSRSVSGYEGISNISPNDADVSVSVSGTTVSYTCVTPYADGATNVSFRINYESSGYWSYYYYWKIKFNGTQIGDSIYSRNARYFLFNGQELDAYDYYNA